MGLVRMAARTAVISGTATAVSGRVAHRQAQQYSAGAAQAQPAAQAPPAADDSATTKLQELANLHEHGVLSDDEFTAAKAKVLGI